jgi:hypothetical protein
MLGGCVRRLGREGRGRRGVEDILEALGSLLGDEVDLEGAGPVVALVLLAISLAENVELHVVEPDAVLGLADHPGRRGRLVRDEGGPDGALAELAFPHSSVEAYAFRVSVLVYDK